MFKFAAKDSIKQLILACSIIFLTLKKSSPTEKNYSQYSCWYIEIFNTN